jgi:hypothetical protein
MVAAGTQPDDTEINYTLRKSTDTESVKYNDHVFTLLTMR